MSENKYKKYNLKALLSKLVSLRAPKGRSNPFFKIASVASLPRNDTSNLRVKVLSFALGFLVFGFYYLDYCFAQQQNQYEAKGLRNPFIPLLTPDGRLIKVSSGETKGGLSLEGIIYDESGVSYCLIDGSVAKIGDVVAGGFQVLKIEKKKVIFIKNGEPTEIFLKEGEGEE
ncbi:MAG: hypothetical protein WC628_03620 [Candidatus Omnitrophota bacterium]